MLMQISSQNDECEMIHVGGYTSQAYSVAMRNKTQLDSQCNHEPSLPQDRDVRSSKAISSFFWAMQLSDLVMGKDLLQIAPDKAYTLLSVSGPP